MTLHQRDDILRHVELRTLMTERLGSPRGHGVSAMWPCPASNHGDQTGRTPPVSVFTSSRGEQRWHCHSCGAGGTAIDLLLETGARDVRAALDELAARAGIEPTSTPTQPRTRIFETPKAPAITPEARTLLTEHVERCEALLWQPAGAPMRAWLHARGFNDEILRANRVGADPGRRRLERPAGLPSRGPGVTLPISDRHGFTYLQTRYLHPRPSGPKYENPSSEFAPNPRFGTVQELRAPVVTMQPTIFVVEGITDALSVAQTGHRAIATLGVGQRAEPLAASLHARHTHSRLIVAFDRDERGAAGSQRLNDALRAVGHADLDTLCCPPGIADLNDWLQRDPRGLGTALGAATRGMAVLPDPSITEPGLHLEL